MRIDSTHRGWCIASTVLLILAGVGYALYAVAASDEGGPKGDTWPGLGFGVAGALMILFAGLIGARKKVLLWRIGSLRWWMRGHLWLGLLSLPMVLFHSAFHLGGALTSVLVILLFIIVFSGLIGAVVQHFVPSRMTQDVAGETTYEQIEREMEQMRVEAFVLVEEHYGAVEGAEEEQSLFERLDKKKAKRHKPFAGAGAAVGVEVNNFYQAHVREFLRQPSWRGHVLADPTEGPLMFAGIRATLSEPLQEPLDRLQGICQETRRKVRQVQLHRLLHGWLLVHIPLSIALMALMVVHAFVALYY
ncbi:MAG: hypothetical protein O7D94_03860 [Planctomycetota bacterium]|nr:hypothetical protein [Planctomycetota bacterium]